MATEERDPAPGGLRLVQELVNTVDLETGDEELDSVDGLRRWLAAQHLGGRSTPGPADLRRALALRESLRRLLLAHNHTGSPVAAAAELRALARDARITPQVRDDGTVALAAADPGVEGLVESVLVAIHAAEADGSWARLKACPAQRCHWAFFDASRNRSGTWCTMAVCGTRAKARSYQRRLRASRDRAAAPAPPRPPAAPSAAAR